MKFDQILFSTPLSKFGYLGGRFLGAVIAATLPTLGVFLAIWLAVQAWRESDRAQEQTQLAKEESARATIAEQDAIILDSIERFLEKEVTPYAHDLEQAKKIIAGTARSMGIEVKG